VEEAPSCSSRCGEGSGNEEREWVLADEGTEGSLDELTRALKSLRDQWAE